MSVSIDFEPQTQTIPQAETWQIAGGGLPADAALNVEGATFHLERVALIDGDKAVVEVTPTDENEKEISNLTILAGALQHVVKKDTVEIPVDEVNETIDAGRYYIGLGGKAVRLTDVYQDEEATPPQAYVAGKDSEGVLPEAPRLALYRQVQKPASELIEDAKRSHGKGGNTILSRAA